MRTKITHLFFLLIFFQFSYSQVTDTGDEVGIGVSEPSEKLEVDGNVKAKTGIFEAFDGALAASSTDYLDWNKYSNALSIGRVLNTNPNGFQDRRLQFFDYYQTTTGPSGSFLSIRDLNLRYRFMLSAWDKGDTRFILKTKDNEEIVSIGDLPSNSPNNPLNVNANFLHLKEPNSRIAIGTWAMFKPEHELTVRGSAWFEENVITESNVGIGTETPQESLHILNGSIRIEDGSQAQGRVLVSDADGKGTWADIGSSGPSTGLWSINGNDIYPNVTRNVGIGTDSPQEKLHVNGSIRGNIQGGALRVQSDHGYLDVGAQSPSYAHIYTDRPRIIFNKDIYTTTNSFSSYNDDLLLKTSGTERIRVSNTTGYVGINTNPDQETQFCVNSTTDVGIKSIVNHTEDYKFGIISAVNRSNTKALSVLLYENNDYVDKFVVMGDGRVKATEVEVKTLIFPDYVFADDYSLMSIEELKDYIVENKHLPNIPSADEVVKNGLELGSMQIKQMEKIEELTLYIINQEDRIKRLEDLVNKLANETKE